MLAASAHPPAPIAEPPAIPGFQFLSPLGEGGMGTVYKAVVCEVSANGATGTGLSANPNLQPGQFVAVKVVNPTLLTDPDMLLRFRREVRASMILDHPNIVTVFDAKQSGDVQYLVMEFVEGIDLEQLVVRAGHLAVARACDYIRQAAMGLDHAHAQGIVHRDIKPPNLMVRGDGVVKILDMGLARLLAPLDISTNAMLTHTGAFLGTADFVAPEQALDARHADARADLYSLGCTMYYLLTGTVPFPGGETLKKLDRHCWDKPIPVTVLRPEVPEAVGHVVAKLMAKRPEDRYQSAAEAAADLRNLSTPSGVLAALAATPITPIQPDTWPLDDASPILPHDPRAVGECGCWEGHAGPIVSVVVTPDGRRAYSAGQDGLLIGWDTVTGAEIARWRACRTGVMALGISPTGRRLFIAGADRHIRTWDAEAQVEVAYWPDPLQAIRCLAVSGNGRYLATGMADGSIRLWYTECAKEARRFHGHRDAVITIAFSPDFTRLVSGSEDHTVRLWDTATSLPVRPGGEGFAEARKGPVNTVAFSPHGRRVLSAGSELCLRLWDVKTGRRLLRLGGHRGPVYSAVFAPNGRHILSGSGDKTVRLWDINSRRELICFTGHNDRVTSVAISPDGRFAVSGSADKTIRLWRFPQ